MPVPATVQIEPLELTIHRGTALLVTNREGWIAGEGEGMWDHDTRYVSAYSAFFNDICPKFLTAETLSYNAAVLTYTNTEFRSTFVTIPELSLFLRIGRIFDEGYHESIEITSFVPESIDIRFSIFVDCNFETNHEVRGLSPVPPRVTREWYDQSSRTLICDYRNRSFNRRFEYRVVSSTTDPRHTPKELIFPVRLRHNEKWQAEVEARMLGQPLGRFAESRICSVGPTRDKVSDGTRPSRPTVRQRLEQTRCNLESWAQALTRIDTPNTTVLRAYEQTIRDLAALRLLRVGDGWYPAAGAPWFTAIFGRDALTTALQSLLLGCPFPTAVLTRLADLQGTRVNRWNDEEPGKIPHELRVSEDSLTGRIPFDPFYGTVDASLLYVILLSETYRFTGQRELLERFLVPAERCLRWAAEYGDIDGDGFIEYWMRGPTDYHNQGWKDAGDAVVYPDGEIVPDPIAIVEVQGYYYDALCRIAEIYRVLGRTAAADSSEARAQQLYDRFNTQFWVPEAGFYAYGLDPGKRPILSVASNPGQLLWSGIVPVERSRSVGDRLMADDMFNGWGIRSLSSQNGRYDPMSYQCGSVWPQDNAIIALGLKRSGHWDHVNRIADGIFAASGFFEHNHLPEVWAGLDRQDTFWPVIYPFANVPQAWAAGSIPLLLRAILGIEADVQQHKLLVRPTLPDWLPEITLFGLAFGGGSFDLRFAGTGAESQLEVLRSSGPVSVEQV